MRLALLSPLPPERNGIADYARHFRDALTARGIDVWLPLAGTHLRNAAEAQRWAHGGAIGPHDVVHAQLGGGRTSEFLALDALSRLPRSQRPLLSATVHDPERLIWRPVHRASQWLEGARRAPRIAKQMLAVLSDPLTLRAERRLAQRLDGLVTLTETGACALAEKLLVPRERLTVIHHGTAPVPLAALPPLQPMRLLYFGFIYRGKGIEDLLDAMARVRVLLPGMRGNLVLTLAGGTAPELAYGAGRDYVAELRARVAALGLSDVVEWALDLPEEDIPALIQSHHAVVLPYRESRKLSLLGRMRGTSGAFAWAVACGRGAITSDARSFAEEIAGGNGVAYSQGDVRALAACMASLLRVPVQAEQWAAAAGRLAVERAWPSTADRFVQCFERWQLQAA